MKTLVKTFRHIVIILFTYLILTQMGAYHVRSNELNQALQIAMSNTQTIAKENVSDTRYGIHASRKVFHNNDEYLQDFKDCFTKLITSNSKFTIKVYGIDYRTGLLDLGVDASFKLWNGETETITARRSSIVDVINTDQR